MAYDLKLNPGDVIFPVQEPTVADRWWRRIRALRAELAAMRSLIPLQMRALEAAFEGAIHKGNE